MRRVAGWSLVASLTLFTVGTSALPWHWPQTLGNMFWATMVLLGGLVWLMRRSAKPAEATALA